MSLRLKAFWLHLSASALLLSVFAGLVLFLWYTPWPLLSLQGGVKILGLMVLVDVVLGPSLTLLVFKPEKKRGELIADMALIVILQLAAFGYGGWILYTERPLFLALAADRFEVVRAPDIHIEAVDKSVAKLAPAYGVQWVSVETPAELSFQQILSRLSNSPGVELKPELYRPLQDVKPELLKKYALPVQEVNADAAVKTWLQAHQLTAEKVLLFPVNGRARPGVAVLSADTREPLGIIEQ
ncbi:MAG: hypothetical protein PHR16_14315 [Methylovulum sp.]|nr:hypothetical protein [Methylovulum sp.]